MLLELQIYGCSLLQYLVNIVSKIQDFVVTQHSRFLRFIDNVRNKFVMAKPGMFFTKTAGV
jgi:hypothetical protein